MTEEPLKELHDLDQRDPLIDGGIEFWKGEWHAVPRAGKIFIIVLTVAFMMMFVHDIYVEINLPAVQ
ncbi:MAG: hypothetical protein WCW66_00925 [Patescibacteria group bacterium]